jgi:limonene-1,2-epoxide hydrolase
VSDPSEVDAILDRFFDAIERVDMAAVEEIYAPEVEVWHNVTMAAIDRRRSIGLLKFFTDRVKGMRYEILERQVWDGGAVQRHIVHGHLGDDPFRLHACIVFHVENGHVVRLFEYLDAAGASAVFDDP